MVVGQMRRAAVAAVCAVLLVLGSSAAKHHHVSKTPNLLQVLTPAGKATVHAHPDVNVVVNFTLATSGAALADPTTFGAKLGGRNIGKLFTPVVQNGTQVGVRAQIPRALVKVVRHHVHH